RARLESSNLYTNYSTTLLNSWTPQNTNTDIPRYIMSDPNLNSRRVSDRWLEDGSFLRLKTLELGYTLPSNITKVANIDNLRIYTAMENLFTITKYKGFTPDLGENNAQNGGTTGTMTRGTDHGRFPLARTISLGVQLTF
nr:SusC/RagA family TonB-linked outer membrane protein [Breznakibacter sp.]